MSRKRSFFESVLCSVTIMGSLAFGTANGERQNLFVTDSG